MNVLSFAAHHHTELRRRLTEQAPDLDEITLADTLEGLTDLHEIVAAIIRSALLDQALAEGLKSHITQLQGRLSRLEDCVSKRRQIARDVMIETEIKKITAPDFTVSVRPGSPSLAVIDEREIPPPYWEAREPRLNRQVLLTDLKAGKEIAGVTLSNPEPVLSVRTK